MVSPHEEPARGQSVPVDPVDGVATAPLRTSGQPDDLVAALDQLFHDSPALGEHGVVGSRSEKTVPVLGFAVEEAKSVPGVGHHAVEVDDGVAQVDFGHSGSSTSQAKPRIPR